MADPNGFHSDYSESDNDIDFTEFEEVSNDILKAKESLEKKIEGIKGSLELSPDVLREIETIKNDLNKYDFLTNDINQRIQKIIEFHEEQDEIESSDDSIDIADLEATWHETERRMTELAERLSSSNAFHNAHQSVKRLANMEQQGKTIETVHTLPAEKKLYAALEDLEEHHRFELQEIIGASPTKSQVVRARFVILRPGGETVGKKTKFRFNKEVKNIIISSETTFQDVLQNEQPKNLKNKLEKFSKGFREVSVSYRKPRKIRKDKLYLFVTSDLRKRVIDSRLSLAKKNSDEVIDFPLGSKYLNKVILTYVWNGR